MTWNTFLTLRRRRRHYNLLASISTSLLTTTIGTTLLASQPLDTLPLFNLDPFVVLGVATAGSAAAGWLIGPFLGNAVFMSTMRGGGRGEEFRRKEKDLYRRVMRHRVDPSSSSAGNPVPDFYGEKIGSVREYRTWMRDQRAYNRRRKTFL